MSRSKHPLEDLDADIREHIARETQDNIDRGMAPDEARFAALRKFGNVARAKEDVREVWITRWLDQLIQDVRYAVRLLRKSPGFTAVAILTLALGIGANAAIFSVVDTIVLRPLPYRDSDRIIFVVERPPRETLTRPDYSTPLLDYDRRYPDLLSQAASIQPGGALLTGVPEPEPVDTAEVSSEYFSLLGWSPAIGRAFRLDDEKPGAAPVAILSTALWERQFGKDPAIVGRTIRLNNVAYTVVGVMPRAFANPLYQGAELWRPQPLGVHQNQWVARMADGASVASVTARLRLAQQTLEGRGAGWDVAVDDLHFVVSGDLRPELLTLLGCAIFVLLVACTNVANLLLARGAARRMEINVRAASGASRLRIARQMLTESIVLGCIGGLAGLAVAYWTLKLVIAIAPAGIPMLDAVRIDSRVLAFAGAASIFTALLFGAIPAFRLTRTDLAASLKEGAGTGAASGVRHSRALSALVASEVALALVLVIGASLTVRSFFRLRPNHPGFQLTNRVSFTMRAAVWKYHTPEARLELIDEVTERLKSLPGVNGVATADFLPLSGMVVFGKVYSKPGTSGLITNSRAVSANYFDVMNIPLLAGRAFTSLDNSTARKVAIVSRRMADQIWPGENVLGKHFTADYRKGDLEIVGVVGDTRESGISLKQWAEYYVPVRQTPANAASFVVSFGPDPKKMAPAIRAAVLSVDKDQAIGDYRTLGELAYSRIGGISFDAVLTSAFGGIALVLAAIGIFGVISYSVKQRTRELGIRIALGASSARIKRAAIGAVMAPLAIGLAGGWGAAYWLARLMSSQLYGLSPADMPANLGAIAVLCVVALAAGYIPAHRAARLDPVVALRHE
jgi:putative ABC transport system permease protein